MPAGHQRTSAAIAAPLLRVLDLVVFPSRIRALDGHGQMLPFGGNKSPGRATNCNKWEGMTGVG